MAAVEITSTLDCKGLACPLPVIKLSKAIKAVAPGAVIELLSTDPGSVADLEAFERRTGHRVLERSSSSGIFRFLVQRAS